VDVEVLPLPASGRPADFDGAVAENLKISARLDRTQVPEGEPITMTVTLSGSGNVRTFSKPRLPELPQFKVYDADSKTEVRNLDRVLGTRTYEIVLVPRGPGEFTIPPVRLSYFDTYGDAYKTLETDPFEVVSTPVAVTAQGNGLDLPADQQEIEVVGTDIAHIRTDVPVSDDLKPLYARGFFLFFVPLPLFALGLAVVVQRRREHLAANVALARSSRARKVAHKRLSQAEKLMAAARHQEFYAEAQRALLQYVGDKLNVAAVGLTHDVLRQKLADTGASHEAGEELVRLLEHCDAARFAPGSFTQESMRSTIGDVEAIVAKLEEAWSRKAGRFVMARTAGMVLALGLGAAVLLAGPAPLVAQESQAPSQEAKSSTSQRSSSEQSAQPSAATEPAASETQPSSEQVRTTQNPQGTQPEPLTLREPGRDFTPPQELLRRGHEAYESGRYAQAVESYRMAEAYGVRNGILYYDLGNAYFKSGQLGEAIAMYRRAERLRPRDDLVRANLQFALDRREDKAVQPAVPFPINLLRALYRQMSLNEWILFTFLLYVLLCGIAMYRVLLRDRRFLVRLALVTTLVIFAFAAATLAYKMHDERGIRRAVITAEKIAVMSGPGKDYTVEFWLHEGSEVQIDEARPDWVRVSMGKNLRGWLPRGSIVRI
jgi:Flp pilus assembly protein TadD